MNRITTLLGDFIISVILGSSCGIAGCETGAEDGGGEGTMGGGGGMSCSLSPTILPPRLLVFSTCKATDIPCSFLPRPWPSLNPYFAMIFAATEEAPYPKFDDKERDGGGGGAKSGASCRDGGGAMAAPPPAPLEVDVLSSSLSSATIVLFTGEAWNDNVFISKRWKIVFSVKWNSVKY